MTLPAAKVWLSLDLPYAGSFFTLDDPVKGVLDNATYVLSGDIPVDVGAFVRAVSITRGRNTEFDEFQAGVATITLNNRDRRFDPAYTAGPYYGNIKRGKRVQVQISTGEPIFTGIVDDWDYDYNTSKESTATMTVVDGLAVLAGINFEAWTATPQATGARVSAVLDRSEVGYPVARDIGTGVSTLQADVVDDGVNVLGYLQLVARSEVGRLFDSTVGLLTLRDRQFVALNLSSAATISDTAGIPYGGVYRNEGKELVRNHVSVTRLGGSTEIATDNTSVADNGTCSLVLDGLLLDSDLQSADMADWFVNAYGVSETRFASVTFKLGRLTETQRSTVAALDIGDPITVQFTPNGVGSSVSQVCVVEGFRHDIQPGEHTIQLMLSRAEQASLFILDDVTYGVLDGPGLLAF